MVATRSSSVPGRRGTWRWRDDAGWRAVFR